MEVAVSNFQDQFESYSRQLQSELQQNLTEVMRQCFCTWPFLECFPTTRSNQDFCWVLTCPPPPPPPPPPPTHAYPPFPSRAFCKILERQNATQLLVEKTLQVMEQRIEKMEERTAEATTAAAGALAAATSVHRQLEAILPRLEASRFPAVETAGTEGTECDEQLTTAQWWGWHADASPGSGNSTRT